MNVEATLERLGLTHQEAVVYVATLKLGSAKVSEIAKKANTKREAAYYTISLLEDKGLVVPFLKSGVAHYSALEPRKILDYIEDEKKKKEHAAQQVLHTLEDIRSTSVSAPTITIYNNIKTIPLANESICGYLPSSLIDSIPDGKQIRLITDNKGAALLKKKYRIIVNDELIRNMQTAYYILESSMLIVKASGDESIAVHIQDEQAAKLQKKIFESIWKR